MTESPSVQWWCAASAKQYADIKAAEWRAWSPESGSLRATAKRELAVADARARLVPLDGVGYVVSFEVTSSFASTHPSTCVEASEMNDLHANMNTAFVEQAEYRGPVADSDFAMAEAALGLTIPKAWRGFLQSASSFRSGWLKSGAYVALLPPLESVRIAESGETSSVLPGALEIGSDGSRERIVLDLRDAAPLVKLVDIACSGWHEAILQGTSLEGFLASIEDGTFDFRFE